MGRTPRVNKNAGRDHWPQCGFCLLAGGTRKGLVGGASDGFAAYVRDFPVTPGDLCATIYHQLGVPLTDADGRTFGAMCHFDSRPVAVDESHVELMESLGPLLLLRDRKLAKAR